MTDTDLGHIARQHGMKGWLARESRATQLCRKTFLKQLQNIALRFTIDRIRHLKDARFLVRALSEADIHVIVLKSHTCRVFTISELLELTVTLACMCAPGGPQPESEYHKWPGWGSPLRTGITRLGVCENRFVFGGVAAPDLHWHIGNSLRERER